MGAKHALPLPRASPQMVALLTSGLTASIGGCRCLRWSAAPSYHSHGMWGPILHSSCRVAP